MELLNVIVVAKVQLKSNVHTVTKQRVLSKQQVLSDTQFCLIQQGDSLHLDHSHAYYYQIQAQLFVCDVQHCDFCVFT